MIETLEIVKKPISLNFNETQITWVTEEICSVYLDSSVEIFFSDSLDSFYRFHWLRCPKLGPSPSPFTYSPYI